LCRQIEADTGGKLIDQEYAADPPRPRHCQCAGRRDAGAALLVVLARGQGPAGRRADGQDVHHPPLHGGRGDLLDLTAPLSLSKRKGAAEAVNLAYRFAHATTIWAGTSEIHRSMIAERALGLPRSRG
jgi:hypothetical protein